MYKEDVKISDLFFKQYRDEIAQRNRIQLGRICIMGGTMSFLLFLISLFFQKLLCSLLHHDNSSYRFVYSTSNSLLFLCSKLQSAFFN